MLGQMDKRAAPPTPVQAHHASNVEQLIIGQTNAQIEGHNSI